MIVQRPPQKEVDSVDVGFFKFMKQWIKSQFGEAEYCPYCGGELRQIQNGIGVEVECIRCGAQYYWTNY